STGRSAATAIVRQAVRRCQAWRRPEQTRPGLQAASDRTALLQCAAWPEARQRPRPDTEDLGEEVSSCCFPEMLNASRIYSPLMFAALMIGHHFSISAL